MRYDAESDFALQLAASQIKFEREWQPIPARRWRLDFACWAPNGKRAAVEIQGGGAFGRHGSSKGMRLDCEKASACAAYGWPLIKADATQVKSGAALQWLLFLFYPVGESPFAKPPRARSPLRSKVKKAKLPAHVVAAIKRSSA